MIRFAFRSVAIVVLCGAALSSQASACPHRPVRHFLETHRPARTLLRDVDAVAHRLVHRVFHPFGRQG